MCPAPTLRYISGRAAVFWHAGVSTLEWRALVGELSGECFLPRPLALSTHSVCRRWSSTNSFRRLTASSAGRERGCFSWKSRRTCSSRVRASRRLLLPARAAHRILSTEYSAAELAEWAMRLASRLSSQSGVLLLQARRARPKSPRTFASACAARVTQLSDPTGLVLSRSHTSALVLPVFVGDGTRFFCDSPQPSERPANVAGGTARP